MAQQSGVIELTGRVGKLTFYRKEDKIIARVGSGVYGKRVKTHPAFARTRENAAEFKIAINAASLFRRAFVDHLKAMADNTIFHRAASLLHKLVRQDLTNNRGSRKILHHTLPALEGFAFNKHKSLRSVLNVPFHSSTDPESGSLSVMIDSFSPDKSISKPDGASHMILTATASVLNFEASARMVKTVQSQPIPLSATHHEGLTLSIESLSNNYPTVLAFGIRFIEIINGFCYDIKGKNHGAMEIVKVDIGTSNGRR